MAWTQLTDINTGGATFSSVKYLGVFKYGGNYYAFGTTPSSPKSNLKVIKASTIGGTWTEQDSSNRPNLETAFSTWPTNLAPSSVDAAVVGDTLVIAVGYFGSGTTGTRAGIAKFVLSTDQWFGTVDTAIDIGTNTNGNGGAVNLTFNSSNYAILFCNGTDEKIMGTDYARVSYWIETLGSLGSENAVDDGGEVDYTDPYCPGRNGDNSSYFIYYNSASGAQFKKYTGSLSSATTNTILNDYATNGGEWPMGCQGDSSTDLAVVLGAPGTTQPSAIEIDGTTVNEYNATSGWTVSALDGGLVWDSTNSRVQAAFRDSAGVTFAYYDPSSNSWTSQEVEAMTSSGSQEGVSLNWDGTDTLIVTRWSWSVAPYVDTYTLPGGSITGTGSLTNNGQALSGSGAVDNTGSGSLTNAGQALSGAGAVANTATGSLSNAAQALAGSGTVAWPPATGTGSLSNPGQAIAGSGAVAVSATGSLSNAAQALAFTATNPVTGTGALSNAAQALAGAGTVPVAGTGSLSNIGQTIAASGAVANTATGSLANVGQAIAGTGDATPDPVLIASTNLVEIGTLGYSRRGGPFKASNGRLYVVGRDSGTNRITVYKSGVDPIADSWTQQDSSNRPGFTEASTIRNPDIADVVQDGDDLWVVTQYYDFTNYDYFVGVAHFDMSTDAWQNVSGTNKERYLIQGNDADANLMFTVSAAPQIVARSDGDIIVTHPGLSENITGTYYSRVEYSRNEGGTWTENVAVDDGGSVDYSPVGATINPSNDDAHIVFLNGFSFKYKTLTSGNSLGSETTANLTMSSGQYSRPTYPWVDGTSNYGLAFGGSTVASYKPSSWKPATETTITLSPDQDMHPVAIAATDSVHSDGKLYWAAMQGASSGNMKVFSWDTSGSTGAVEYDTGYGLSSTSFLSATRDGTTMWLLVDMGTGLGIYKYNLPVPSATGSGSLSNNAQALSGAGAVAVSATGSLTNSGQALAGAVSVAVAGTGSLTNAGQALAGSAAVAVSVSGSLTNAGQALAGTGSVLASATGSLANEPQALAGTAAVLVQATGSLANAGQSLAASGTVLTHLTGSLTNAGQALAATGTVAITGSGSLTNAGQALSGVGGAGAFATGALSNEPQALAITATNPLTGTGSLTNAGQALSVSASNPVSGSGSLSNAPQSLTGAAVAVNTATGSLANPPQTLTGSGVVPIAATGALANAPQALAGSGVVPITGTGSLSNVGQILKGKTGWVGQLTNAGQSLSGAGTVAIAGTGSLQNAGQALAGSGSVSLSGSGSLSNVGQAIAGSFQVTISGTAILQNVAQSLGGAISVLVTGTGALGNEPQAIYGIEIGSDLASYNDLAPADIASWNGIPREQIDTYNGQVF